MNHTPPFTVSAKAVVMVAEIAARIERHAARMTQENALRLRRTNKIKTIRSSLAIEGNTLSEDQVTAILEGRKVVAPIREIQEVKNAIAAYDLWPELNPFSMADLLKAHGVMMAGLVERPGEFRRGGAGVAAGGEIIHMAPPAGRVPTLVADLFHWLENAEDHLLIRSCVFHYEFEVIHPFDDGNGRIGRLWQSLILGRLHPAFQYLPVETMVHGNQQKYYNAINDSTTRADSGCFIDFMLREILAALDACLNPDGGVNDGVNGGVTDVLAFIAAHPGCRANAISPALSIPLRTLERYIRTLRNAKQIEFRGAPRNGGYWPAVEKTKRKGGLHEHPGY